MRIVLLEDDPDQLADAERCLSSLAAAFDDAFEVEPFSSSASLVEAAAFDRDIYLLDIQMEGMSGMEVARLVRRSNPTAAILFLTNSPSYAIEGYSVGALDYILKPVDARSLGPKLRRAADAVCAARPHSLTIQSKGRLTLVAENIAYVETINRRTVLHMRDRSEHTCYESLASLRKKLPANLFFQCHAAFIVNIRAIEKLSPGEVVVGGASVPVSRGKRKGFMDFIASRFGAW